MKKILLLLLIMIMIPSLVFAAPIITNYHGVDLTDSATYTFPAGEKVKILSNMTLPTIVAIEVKTGVAADYICIYNTSNGNNCDVCSAVSSLNATFDYQVNNNSDYIIAAQEENTCTNSTGSYNGQRLNIAGYPYVNPELNWINRCYYIAGWICDTTEINNIMRVYMEDGIAANPTASFVSPTPLDGSTNNTQVMLNISCDPSNSTLNLWFDNETDPSTLVLNEVSSPNNYSTSVTINQEYFYKASCDNGFTNTSVRSWTYDTTLPEVSTDFVNNTKIYNINLSGQFNFSDNILLNSVNFSIDGETIFANESILETTFNYYLNYNTRILSRGNHLLTVTVADAHTARELKEDYEVDRGFIFNNELKYTFPSKTYINSKVKGGSLADVWTSERFTDRYRQTLIPFNPTSTIVIIEESNHPIQIVNKRGLYKGQWIIIDGHWKDYVIKNEPKSKVSITRLTESSVEVTISGLLNPSNLEFDSVGDLNIVTKYYNFTTQNVTETYSSIIFDGFTTTYLLDIINPPVPNPSAILNLNGTNYTTTVDFSNVNQVRYTYSYLPNVTIIGDSISFFHNWFFNLTSSGFDYTDIVNQTLFNITVDNCSVNTFPILNMSYIDEEDNTEVIADNQYDLSFFDGNSYNNVSGTFTGRSSDAFCTNINPNISVFNFLVDGDILSLSASGYATRLFEFPPSNPIAASNSPVGNLTLPLIMLNSSRSVNYEWITTEFQPINGILRINKCLPGNNFLLVESTPIIDSLANANIQTLNTAYSYEVIIDGVTYNEADGYSKCHLESEDAGAITNPLRFYVEVHSVDINEYIGLYDTDCSITKTGVDTVKMTWGTNSQDATLIEGCINAFRSSAVGNILTYTNCSAGGSIERTIPNTGYDYYVAGEIIQGDKIIPCENSVYFRENSASLVLFGLSAVFGVILLIIAFALFFAGNGEAQLVGVVIGIGVTWFLGIMAFNWMIVSSLIIFVLIVLGVGRYSRS